MLNCEYCGKTFNKEGFLKRHINSCKKKDSVVKTEDVVVAVDDPPLVVIEEDKDVVSSSSDEETFVAPVVTTHINKKVTFKDRESNDDRLEKLLSPILSKLTQLNTRLNSLESKLTSTIDTLSLSNNKNIDSVRHSVQTIDSSLSNLTSSLSNLTSSFNAFCSKANEPKSPPQVVIKEEFTLEEPVVEVPEEDYCLILATNEDRLKRRLFKICLIENWDKQQDKVKDTYHVIMERVFNNVEDGNKALKQIEDNFAKRRVSANKKWYKLRDNDLEEVVDLFN
jgi:Skp family chaperone for outer membrane proteins